MIAESLNIPKTVVLLILKEDFCSPDFFLLHDNVPAHKAASVCKFLIQKMLQPFITTSYFPDLYPPGYFLFPKLKMKLKGLHFVDVAEIQEAVTDELKKIQKRNFRQVFRNCTTAQKPAYMLMELILNQKVIYLPHVSSI
jgi:hypothetical protein